MSRKQRLAPLLAALGEVFDREITDTLASLYDRALCDIPPERLEIAVERALRICRFMPKPAELRELAGANPPSLADSACVAWADAWDAVDSVGAYRSVEFADPLTSATIHAMGGWVAFCRPEQDPAWHRKEFLETYRALAASGRDFTRQPLAGICDADNKTRFPQHVKPPRLVGPTATAPRPKALTGPGETVGDGGGGLL